MILQNFTDTWLRGPTGLCPSASLSSGAGALACLELPVPEVTVRKHVGPLSGRVLGALPGRATGREVRPPHGVC